MACPISYGGHNKIWSVMQQCVWKTKICDIDDLQKRLMQTWFDFEQNVIEARLTNGTTV